MPLMNAIHIQNIHVNRDNLLKVQSAVLTRQDNSQADTFIFIFIFVRNQIIEREMALRQVCISSISSISDVRYLPLQNG